MARAKSSANLTANNLIYLYRLLSQELGCGRQTFLPAVEEALASDQMTADDLGFDSTRDLLEALEVFVKLTIFKGGRIYATIIAQPTWDEALAAFEATDGKKTAGESSGKPWKRKKADKTLKPVRPKRAKRPEPEPKPVPAQEPELECESAQADGELPSGLQPEPASAPESVAAPGRTAPSFHDTSSGSSATSDSGAPSDAIEPSSAPDADTEPEQPAAREAAAPGVDDTSPDGPRPAISLTVVYDPTTGLTARRPSSHTPSRPHLPRCALRRPKAPFPHLPRTLRNSRRCPMSSKLRRSCRPPLPHNQASPPQQSPR